MTGLILEGGAMRGLFTAGVLDVWMENDLRFDGAIGVSAGAVFGCNYKSGQRGRTLRYNLRYCRDWRYCSVRSWLETGDLYGAEFCYVTLPVALDPFDYEAYAADPMPFYVVCTDAATGQAVYRRCDRADGVDRDWFRASASMPVVSRPVEIEGRAYLDGGVADSVPVRYFENIGYRRNVLILTQPKGFVKQSSRALPLMKPLLHDHPRIAQALAVRHEVYNETSTYIDRREREGEALVIRPETALDVSRTERDPAKLQAAYDQGRAAGEKHLRQVTAFLKG